MKLCGLVNILYRILMFPSERFISSLIKIRHWRGGGGGREGGRAWKGYGKKILYKKNPAFILGEKLAATVERGSSV
jgi:hypothetical protein